MSPTQRAQKRISNDTLFGAGEGTRVAATIQKVESESETYNFNFDLEQVPAPDRRFFADAYFVTRENDGLKVSFLQTSLDGGIRSVVDVYLHQEAVNRFKSLMRDFEKFSIEGANSFSGKIEEPKQAASFVANYMRISAVVISAVLDFYYVSPFALQALLKNKNTLAVEGVIRVQMSSGMLKGVLAKILE